MAYVSSSYASVVYLTTDFGQGSAVIIGKHTLLTASHMVWSTDQNRTTGAFTVSAGPKAESTLSVSTAGGGATLHYKQVNDAGGSISTYDSQYDYAVINVSADLSAYGAMALSASFTSGEVHVTGYPSTAAGAQTDNVAIARSSRFYEVLNFNDTDVTHGNSGGPLWTMIGGVATVVGIVSSGSATSETAARINVTSYAEITSWIGEANTRYSQPVAAPVIGRPSANTGFSNYFGNNSNDAIAGSTGNDFIYGSFGNDSIDGKAGFDQVIYSSGKRADYVVSGSAASVTVSKTALGGTDALLNVERIQFSDAIIAFDATGDLGQAYRLYQAAFNRTPDQSGLTFWVRYLDNGGNLTQAAVDFTQSVEFKSIYGQSPTSRQIVEAFYRNVLGRDGEASGVDFWTASMAAGSTTGQILAGFSESQENVGRLAGVIANGVLLDLF